MADIQSYLDAIKTAQSGEAVRDAIVKCMEAINADGAITLKSYNTPAIKNTGVYTYTADNGEAWKKVTVNVESLDGSDPTEYKYATKVVDDNTQNGEYDAETELDENTYWNKIVVDVNRRYEDDTIFDEAVAETTAQDEKGTYWDAAWVGAVAVKRLYFSNEYMLPDQPIDPVDPTTKTFTVTFLDRNGQTLGSVGGVPYGGSIDLASAPTPPEVSGKVFNGWNPQPYNVTYDMKCKAQYTSAIGGSTDWSEIITNAGAVNIGEIVPLVLTNTVAMPLTVLKSDVSRTSNHNVFWECRVKEKEISTIGVINMMKVADAPQTFLATTPLRMNYLGTAGGYGFFVPWDHYDDPEYPGTGTIPMVINTNFGVGGYRNGILKMFLDGYLWKVLPEDLRNSIAEVSKPTYGVANKDAPPDEQEHFSTEQEVSCKIWLPSMREISHLTGSIDHIDTSHLYNDQSWTWDYEQDPNFTNYESGTAYTVWEPDLSNMSSGGCSIVTRTSKPVSSGNTVLHRLMTYWIGASDYEQHGFGDDYILSQRSTHNFYPNPYANNGTDLYIGFCLKN